MRQLLFIWLTLLALSCGSTNQTSTTHLMAEHYTILELNGKTVTTENPTITFDLKENRVFGYSGCNTFNGTFTVENNTITFGPIAATKKMCPDISSENELFKILQRTKTFSVENDVLTLSESKNVLLKASVSAQEKKMQPKEVSFSYQAISRGFFLIITASNTNHAYTVSTAQGMKPAKQSYTEEKWNQLMEALETINVEDLSALEPPSKKHQFDGAPIATLKITLDAKTYQTPAFDHGNPPAEIQELVKILLSFAEKE